MITVASMRPDDIESLAALMDELERFYGGEPTESLKDKVDQIAQALFSEDRAGFALLAWAGDKAAGFASYSFLWPAAGFTRSLYLKELYVAQAYRRTGVGRLLMDELHVIAGREQCSRVEWTTDAPNEDARSFYESLGYAENGSKIFYRSTL